MPTTQELRKQIGMLLDEEFLPVFIREVIRDAVARESASDVWLQKVLAYLQSKRALI